jgi:N-acetylglucosaminyl-diphospho-decaprenol L-rhamnosyltransferase
MDNRTLAVTPDLAVIIVSWSVRDLLRVCLTSLLLDIEHSAINARVILVDSASRDDTPAMVRESFPGVELIACEQNIGFVKGNNLGAERLGFEKRPGQPDVTTIPPFVWFLNPDTEVRQGATKLLLEFMRAHGRCGMCGPRLINPDGSLQHGAFAFPGLVQLALETQPVLWRFRGRTLDGRYPAECYEQQWPFPIGHPLGAAMFVRTQAIVQVGMLDPGYEMYAEEVDWAMRMKRAGWERWCVPAAVVVHYGGASSGQVSERAERIKWRSRRRYYSLHYSPLKRRLAMLLVPPAYRIDI